LDAFFFVLGLRMKLSHTRMRERQRHGTKFFAREHRFVKPFVPTPSKGRRKKTLGILLLPPLGEGRDGGHGDSSCNGFYTQEPSK
jgi:hypothetical protein